jgi:hypothetical protein
MEPRVREKWLGLGPVLLVEQRANRDLGEHCGGRIIRPTLPGRVASTKPVSEMTDEELDAFARAVWEEIVQKMRSEPPVDPHGSSPA